MRQQHRQQNSQIRSQTRAVSRWAGEIRHRLPLCFEFLKLPSFAYIARWRLLNVGIDGLTDSTRKELQTEHSKYDAEVGNNDSDQHP